MILIFSRNKRRGLSTAQTRSKSSLLMQVVQHKLKGYLVFCFFQLVQELRHIYQMNRISLSESGRLAKVGPGRPPSPASSNRAAFVMPRCPHVVAFYDAYTDPEWESVCMVLEYLNAGTLQVGGAITTVAFQTNTKYI